MILHVQSICFDNIVETDEVVYCRTTCGNPVHTKCMDVWIAQKRKKTRAQITCVYCRSPWEDPRNSSGSSVSGGMFNNHGYENSLQLVLKLEIRISANSLFRWCLLSIDSGATCF